MTWLKLTMLNDKATLINMNMVTDIIIGDGKEGSFISFFGDDYTEVKESLEEIEAMLNKNEQPSMAEVVAKDVGRDYIGYTAQDEDLARKESAIRATAFSRNLENGN